MKIGDIIKLEITDTNDHGVGVGKVDGAVVFVPSTVKGDTAEVYIASQEKNFFTGECVNVITKSEYRTVPECNNKDCGGCTLAHISYAHENEIKMNSVKSAFRRAGLDHSIVGETVHSKNRLGYRNKITVHYSEKDNAFGLYADKSNDVVEFDHCPICDDILSEVVRFTNANIRLLSGIKLTSLCVRTNSAGNVFVSLYCDKKADVSGYVTKLAGYFPTLIGVSVISDGKGGGFISDSILGINMRFSSEAFRQVNTEAFELLLGIVHEFATQKDFSCGADLYCGSGIIGLSLAKRFPNIKFYGIEINREAVEDAKYNAAANGIKNIEFFSGDSASFKKKVGKGKLPELIVVDPPRAGLSKEMRSGLVELSPKRIIYVSCNPQTLARDLTALKQRGYEIKSAVPVNMFPMTSHCECVVSLEKTK